MIAKGINVKKPGFLNDSILPVAGLMLKRRLSHLPLVSFIRNSNQPDCQGVNIPGKTGPSLGKLKPNVRLNRVENKAKGNYFSGIPVVCRVRIILNYEQSYCRFISTFA